MNRMISRFWIVLGMLVWSLFGQERPSPNRPYSLSKLLHNVMLRT
jgi:hypothetical protein